MSLSPTSSTSVALICSVSVMLSGCQSTLPEALSKLQGQLFPQITQVKRQNIAGGPSKEPPAAEPERLAGTSPPAPVQRNPKPNPIFRPIFPALKYQTKIPIFLPSFIPETGPNDPPIYAILLSGVKERYSILLAFTEDCRGGNACRLGELSGARITDQSSAASGEIISLAENNKGYFNDAKCGATCSDSTISWDQNKHRYQIGIKARKKETLIEMANSAIANGPL